VLAGVRWIVNRDGALYAPNSPYSSSKGSSDFLVRDCFHTHMACREFIRMLSNKLMDLSVPEK